MKKTIGLLAVCVLFVGFGSVWAQSRTETPTGRVTVTTAPAPTISNLTFYSPKSGSTFNIGDTVNVNWDFQSSGDVSGVRTAMTMRYWDAAGTSHTIYDTLVSLSSKSASLKLPTAYNYYSSASPSQSYDICLWLTYKGEPMSASSCAPSFAVNTPTWVTSVGFSTPKPGTIFSVGDTVNIQWSIKSQGDTSKLSPNLKIGYWDNGGFKTVASYVLKTTDVSYAWPISYTTPSSANYQACLNFYGAVSDGDSCINFVVKGPVTVPVVDQKPATVPAAANDTKVDVLGLNLKILKPNHETIYQGDALNVSWTYNPQFVKDPSKQGKLAINELIKVKKWFWSDITSLEPKEIKSIMVPMGAGANTSVSVNTDSLKPGEYSVILNYQGEDTTEPMVNTGSFTIIKKTPTPRQPTTVTNVGQGKIAGNNANVQNVSLVNQNKLKEAMMHLEQATKLLKELLGE